MILWARMDAAGNVIGEDRMQRRRIKTLIGPRGIPPLGQPQIDGAMTIDPAAADYDVIELPLQKNCQRWPHV